MFHLARYSSQHRHAAQRLTRAAHLIITLGLCLTALITWARPSLAQDVPLEVPQMKQAPSDSERTADVGVPHPFFWEVQGPQGARGYLMGTVHVPDERWERFPKALMNALDQADALYAEIDLRDKQALSMHLLAKATLPPGQTLKEIIGASLFERMDQYLKRRGQSALYMNNFHPKMAEMTLGLLELMPLLQSGKPALDEWLLSRANKAGKIVGGVETIDEQLNALMGGTTEEAIDSLRFTISQLETKEKKNEKTFEKLIEIYFSGDAARVDAFMKSELEGAPEALLKSMDRLLNQRNQVMAKRIIKLFEEHPKRIQVFAFGVAHFVGEGSVTSLLRAQGYRVSRRFAPTAYPHVTKE